MNRKELHALMLRLHGEQKDLLAKARTETDPEKQKTLLAAAKLKAEELAKARADYEEAKSQEETDEFLAAEAKALKPNLTGVNLGARSPQTPEGKTVSAERIETRESEAKADHLAVQAFLGFMQGKSLSQEQRNRIAPDAKFFRNDDLNPNTTVIIPRSMAKRILEQNPYRDKAPAYRGPQDQALLDFAKNILLGKADEILSVEGTGGATDAGGGFLWPDLFIPQVQEFPLEDPSLYDLCMQVPASNGKATYPKVEEGTGGGDFGGVAFTWKNPANEGTSVGETNPTFGSIAFSTFEVSGWTAVSNTMLRRSAIDLQSFLVDLYGRAVRREFSKVIHNGAAASYQPTGIVEAVTASANIPVRATINEVVWADLIACEFAVTKACRTGARFLIHDTVEKFLKAQEDTTGRPIFTSDAGAGPRNTLAGYPYISQAFPSAPSLGTAGDCLFGNLRNYMFGVEQDIAIARSDHAEFKSNLVIFRLVAYAGGKPMFATAFSKLKATTT